MKYENFEKVKDLAKKIEFLTNLHSGVSNSASVSFVSSSGFPKLSICFDEKYNDRHSAYGIQFRDTIAADIQAQIDDLMKQLEEL